MKNISAMDIDRIEIAHEFVLNRERTCEYPFGRGSFGIVYVIEGEAEYRFLTGESIRISTGDTLLLFPKSAYRILTRDDFCHYTVNFTLHNDINTEDIYWCFPAAEEAALARSFSRICELWRARLVGFSLRAKGLLYEILSMLEQREHEREGAIGGGLLRAKAYIDHHFSEHIDVDTLSRVAEMSQTNFRRRFRQTFGETAMQYRDRVRISLASQYLASGYYNVSEVGRAVGFEDVSYFVRFFKRHTGQSPGVFIKK